MNWTLSHRFDEEALPLADRHYNRRKVGSPQFVPPGRCVVFKTRCRRALWVTSWPFGEYVKHAWPGAWVNSLFRNEGAGLSSELIRDAIAATRNVWPATPCLGMVSFVDASKIRRKRDPGRCYRRAGFNHVGFTQGGLWAFQMLPDAMPAPYPPPTWVGSGVMDWLNKTHVGDCRVLMRRMITAGVKVQCIVTSPPYWGLRDYGAVGQFGLERTWIRHVARMRHVFRLTRELLSDDGTLWLNYGDSYAGAPGGYQGRTGQRASRTHTARIKNRKGGNGLKPKDLVGMPWRVALALQNDGWWLRSDIIWHKPSPMPESVYDRPTKAHEYFFLLSKSAQYHYDAAAIAEPVSGNAHARGTGINPKSKVPAGWDTGDGGHDKMKGRYSGNGVGFGHGYDSQTKPRAKQNESFSGAVNELVSIRNMRTVWTIASEPTTFAHFATFPRELVRRAMLAGTRPGDIVFDPFMGSGTVAEVAQQLGRQFIGCELNPIYAAMFRAHRSQQQGMAI